MISTRRIGGRSVPVIDCDACGDRIENSDLAWAIWTQSPEGCDEPMQFAHKDGHGKFCIDKTEAKIKAAGGRPGSSELSLFLARLCHNVQQPKDLERDMEDLANM